MTVKACYDVTCVCGASWPHMQPEHATRAILSHTEVCKGPVTGTLVGATDSETHD